MASGHSEDVYTDEVQNGVRLAALLINEGTKVIKNLFYREINIKYRSLQSALKQNKKKLKTLSSNPHSKRPSKLTKPQFRKLYPSASSEATSADEFDITLLTLLLDVICNMSPPPSTGNWYQAPDEQDHSDSADIIRLRMIRNKIYGHISHIDIDNSEFASEWSTLRTVLCRLGATEADCDKWMTESLEPKSIKNIKDKLQSLIENDLMDAQAVRMHLIETIESLKVLFKGETLAKINEVKQLLTEMNEVSETVVREMLTEIRNLGRMVGVQNFTLKLMTMDNANRVTTIQALGEEIQSNLGEHKDFLSSIKQEQQLQGSSLSQILENTTKLVQRQNNDPCNDNDNLREIHDIIKSNLPDSFKVLILNEPQTGNNFNCLAESLGYVPWDIVLDLDHDALSRDKDISIYDHVLEVLGKHKCPKTITYKEWLELTDDEKERIAKGQTTLWIQVNGCSCKGCEQVVKKFTKAKVNILTLLISILKKIPTQKSLFCATIMLTKSLRDQISDLQKAVKEAFEYNEEILAEQGVTHFTLGCSDCALEESALPSPSSSDARAIATDNQISHMFRKLFHQDFVQSYSYPGNHGDCYISVEEMTQLQTVMELYHRKIGEMDFSGMNPEQISDTVTNIRENYQKGSVIDPNALYLHSEHRDKIYVKRKEMKQMEEAVREDLIKRKRNIRKQRDGHKGTEGMYVGLYSVEHDACGGATTCVRHLLYTFRTEYPCIELKQLDQMLIDEVLKKLYKNSNLPLLIVADGADFSTSDIWILRKRLSNYWMQGLVIHTKRTKGQNQTRPSNEHIKEIRIYIPARIEDSNDLSAFRDLYDHGMNNKGTKKVFLFGLLAFLQGYKKCNEHIETCIEELNPVQASMVRIVCFVWKYSHIGVKTRLLLKYFKANTPPEAYHVNQQDIMYALGYASDMLVNAKEKFDDIVRPAVNFIVDSILGYLDTTDDGDRLRKFTDDFKAIVEIDGDEKTDASNLVFAIFSKRDKEAGLGWSEFVMDLELWSGQEYVESVLKQFVALTAQCRQGPHVKTLYARYLMLKMKKPEEAIRQIKSALGLSETESVRYAGESENILLSAYGNMYRYKAKNYFKANLRKSVNNALMIAQSDIQEAIIAFEKAQKSTMNHLHSRQDLHTPVPFWSEAFARHLLLSYYLEHRCHFNLTEFRRFLETTENDLLRECESKAQEALQRLEMLLKLDKVNDDNPGLTSQRILEAKFNFLKLRVDKVKWSKMTKDSKHLRQAINEIPDTVTIDIGSFMLIDHDTGLMRHWSDLGNDELEFIIQKIDRRIHLPNALAHYFQHIVLAMIHIRQLGQTQTSDGKIGFSSAYAMKCASLWVNKFRGDHEAHFLLGVLKMVDGIENENHRHILDGQSSLKKCKEICEARKSTKSYRRVRFFVAKGSGLAKLLPPKQSDIDDEVRDSSLETFNGRLSKKKEKYFVYSQCGAIRSAFKAEVTKALPPDLLARVQHQPWVQCNIYFAHDKIIAINVVRLINVSDDEGEEPQNNTLKEFDTDDESVQSNHSNTGQIDAQEADYGSWAAAEPEEEFAQSPMLYGGVGGARPKVKTTHLPWTDKGVHRTKRQESQQRHMNEPTCMASQQLYCEPWDDTMEDKPYSGQNLMTESTNQTEDDIRNKVAPQHSKRRRRKRGKRRGQEATDTPKTQTLEPMYEHKTYDSSKTAQYETGLASSIHYTDSNVSSKYVVPDSERKDDGAGESDDEDSVYEDDLTSGFGWY